MANYLTLALDGVKTLVAAITASTGVADADKIIATDANGLIDPSFLPPNLGGCTEVAVAQTALTAGDFVELFDDGGTLTARLADDSLAQPASGFVLDTVTLGSNVTVYLDGENTALTGLTAGETYWLDAAGAIALAPSITDNFVVQRMGEALNATTLCFNGSNDFCAIDIA